jgi:hypothetical protein
MEDFANPSRSPHVLALHFWQAKLAPLDHHHNASTLASALAMIHPPLDLMQIAVPYNHSGPKAGLVEKREPYPY